MISDILASITPGTVPDLDQVEMLMSAEGKDIDLLFEHAREAREKEFGNRVYTYGFVYFSTYCRNNCTFCYYRKSNGEIPRYRKTKEEIVLALLHREYLVWAADLDSLAATASGGAAALADGLADTLDRRETMLRLMSTSLFEMEAHSRVTALADFKRGCKLLMAALDGCVAAFCPELDADARERFAFAFLPFVYGVYPYSTVTEKQRMAMDQADMRYAPPAQHEMVRQGAAMLLGGK